MDRITARYNSVLTLVEQGATEGERKAAAAAARRMFLRHFAPAHPVSKCRTGAELRQAMEAAWAASEAGNDRAMEEAIWILETLDDDLLLAMSASIKADLRPGWVRGVYVGSMDLRMCDMLAWLGEWIVERRQKAAAA